MKKIIALVLALVLTVAASVAGTVAYLQAEDSDVNVMTLGNVEIEQIEQEYNANELVDFTQGKPLYPYVGELGWKNTETGNGAYRQFTMENVVDKYVSVKNTGKSDAYVRTFVALEMGDYTYDKFNMVGISINSVDGAEFDFDGSWKMVKDFVAEIDGKNYNVMEFVHQTAVAPGVTTIPSLLQVYLSKDATNETVEKLDGNDNGTYDILVLSQAVQTEGFANAAIALDTAFGELNAKNAAEWFGDLETPVVVSNAEELTEALEAGKSVVLNGDVELTETVNIEKAANIDLNGHNLTVTVLEAKADTTISNGTVTHGKSTYPALSVSAGTLELDNVDVVCNEYCNLVTSGTAEAAEYAGIEVWNGKLVLNDSTITVSTDKIRYSNSIFAIGIHAGEVTMNGGAITVKSHGSTKDKYDYPGVIFAGSSGEKTVTLNNVEITSDIKNPSSFKYLFAWGGHTTLNTTDTVTAEMVDARNGGTYTIQ